MVIILSTIGVFEKLGGAFEVLVFLSNDELLGTGIRAVPRNGDLPLLRLLHLPLELSKLSLGLEHLLADFYELLELPVSLQQPNALLNVE